VTGADAEVLGYHLRRLSPAEFAAFVADLWAARGYDTERGDGVVVATRGTESVVLGVGGRTTDAVDVVVTPAEGPVPGIDPGVRVVDAAGIRDALRYAVDRETAATLCREHLGAAPGDLGPPLRRRVRARLARAGRAVPDPAALGVAVAVVAVVVVAVAGATLGPDVPVRTPTAGEGALDAGADADGPAGPTPGATPTRGRDPTGIGAQAGPLETTGPGPPGLSTTVDGGRGGITDLTALGQAHRRALERESYTLWVDLYRPRDGVHNATRVHRDIDVSVDGDRYRLVETVEPAGGGERTRSLDVYREADGWYAATGPAGNATYERGGESGLPPPGLDPHYFTRTLVRQWLFTANSSVTERVTEAGEIRYRVVGSGQPESVAAAQVANYTVTAEVAPDGAVLDARATYTFRYASRGNHVRVEWTYGNLGTTRVVPPDWYAARYAGNGSTAGATTPAPTTAATPRPTTTRSREG
jgi:hypothetical protein